MQKEQGADNASYVRGLFSSIAHRYDLINSLLSLRRDSSWRDFAVEVSGVGDGALVLDLATGTGELARRLARRCGGGRVVGLDFCPEMLRKAGEKLDGRRPGNDVDLVLGDVLKLPFPDGTFDCVTMAFGLRNVSDVAVACREISRVAKPGARVAILELTLPTSSPIGRLYRFGMFRLAPLVGRLMSGSREAYTYLPNSIADFLSPGEVKRIMQEAGLESVEIHSLDGGVATVHAAAKSRWRCRDEP